MLLCYRDASVLAKFLHRGAVTAGRASAAAESLLLVNISQSACTSMVDNKKEREMQLMRMLLVAAQTVIIVNDVTEMTVATGTMPISYQNTAQTFEGWGTSLAWFGEYVGMLEGAWTALLTWCCLLILLSQPLTVPKPGCKFLLFPCRISAEHCGRLAV